MSTLAPASASRKLHQHYHLLIVEEEAPGRASLKPSGYSTHSLHEARIWCNAFNKAELKDPVRAWAVIAINECGAGDNLERMETSADDADPRFDVLVVELLDDAAPAVQVVKQSLPRGVAEAFADGFNGHDTGRPLSAVVVPHARPQAVAAVDDCRFNIARTLDTTDCYRLGIMRGGRLLRAVGEPMSFKEAKRLSKGTRLTLIPPGHHLNPAAEGGDPC